MQSTQTTPANTSRFEAISNINHTCACLPLQQFHVAPDTAGAQTNGSAPKHQPAQIRFANTAVFISQQDQSRINAVIEAVNLLTTRPAYRQYCEARNAQTNFRNESTHGYLSGLDFHLTPTGPQLIEVNTNAGGAFLSQAMIKAHNRTLSDSTDLCSKQPFGCEKTIACALQDMITSEWKLACRGEPAPGHIAIVDDNPLTQYLYPDMLLARQLLQNSGTTVSIVAASDLQYDHYLHAGDGRKIDFVYNRLTDFQLTEATHSSLLHAWQDDAVVLSPSPLHHSLLADKRNLQIYSDAKLLKDFGLPEAHRTALQAVPATEQLDPDSEASLWQHRKQYYFKPLDGYGSKAVYRGSKITRKVWSRISGGSHVAQKEIVPTSRLIEGNNETSQHKFDIRAYAYNGQSIALVARLYQGQTTNFRTPGGGFAPVMVLPDWACIGATQCC